MNIENQVCTLEQAQKLKELGIAQNMCYFYWERCPLEQRHTVKPFDDVIDSNLIGSGNELPVTAFSAFTVAEMGVLLPGHIGADLDIAMDIENFNDQFYVCYPSIKTVWGDTEAEARANMLIYMIETGKLTDQEINQRLQTILISTV
jgi:hypothetical protein